MKSEKKSILISNRQNNLALMDAFRQLSRRESEILFMLLGEKTVKNIAEECFLSESTVRNHISNIGNTLGIKGKGELRKWLKSATNELEL